jgi:hypothetical protein
MAIITLFELLENDARMCQSIAEGGAGGGGGELPWGDVLPTQVSNVFFFLLGFSCVLYSKVSIIRVNMLCVCVQGTAQFFFIDFFGFF